jgi:type I restriction-modification system DNA methylase subunit
MTSDTDQRENIVSVLKGFARQPLADAARALFATLGYASERRIAVATPQQFCEELDPQNRLADRERETLDRLTSLHFLFQLTDSELTSHGDLFDNPSAVQTTQIHSYVFFAAELPEGHYTRTDLSAIARALNKPLSMPALLLLKHGDTVSLAIIHRRLNKRDTERDVLEKATLIKDIRLDDPIRAHLEILNDFAFANLDADFGTPTFVKLHEAWQKRLSSYALSNDFYREIADWYFWAHHLAEDGTLKLPEHCDTEQEKSLFLIRLLTRVIFCWFLVEKRLIPADLFRDRPLKKLLKDLTPAASTYYHAILQNLFFGTLNMPDDLRCFRDKKKDNKRYDPNYGITNLWRYQTDFKDSSDWVVLSKRIPFLNGGLFDCLDDKSGKKQDNSILDGFSDNPTLACQLPNDLFFGPERTVDLSKDYGEEDKRTARSKRAKVRGLIEILSRYKFTIEENTPLEEEIALDPELLGKVFENLLASYNEDTRTTARKALGAFYTPREIVSYMVDEALKSYLSTQVPRCKGALDDLFSNKATLKEIKPDTRDALIAAIGRVKILDPACGSGAFPMGALHRLVDLLQKLDPNNESWKRDRLEETERYRKVLEESGAPKEEIAACDARIEDITKSFDTRFHALDFARKLYLIENGIYGVDIQPVAVQIAKLRFFISLVVDQKVCITAKNLGVRPLPNLETRLVAADSLIPLPKPAQKQASLFDDDVEAYLQLQKLKDELKRIRHEHFNARDPDRKRHWRDEDQRVRETMRDLLRKTGLSSDAAKAMSAWDPYDQNTFAPFFDSEWMFGLKPEYKQASTILDNLALVNETDGQMELSTETKKVNLSGFDIVIGNPPYIRIQTLKQSKPDAVTFFKEYYSSASKGNYDIYVVFIEAGLRLLKSNGTLAYICPNKFFNADYGESLRGMLAQGQNLYHVVNFGDQQVFLGATIYTCLLFLSRNSSASCRYSQPKDLYDWLQTFKAAETKICASQISSAPWHFTAGPASLVMEKLNSFSRRLGNVADRIYQGLVTGADSVFILKNARGGGFESLATGQEHEIESTLMHPLCKGSVDIRRYFIGDLEKSILFPYHIIDGEAQLISVSEFQTKYPRAWKYLLQNRNLLEAREGGKWKHDKWYALGRSQNLTQMEKRKILTPSIASSASFTLDECGSYYFVGSGGGGGGGYGITIQPNEDLTLVALLGILNSTPVDFFVKNVSTPFANGYFAYNRQFIEQIPIPSLELSQIKVVEKLVGIRLYLSKTLGINISEQSTRDPLMLAYFEQILNGLVYELYFSEEVYNAGLYLFDVVEKAKLPSLDTLPEADRLPHLRTLFESLYDGTHPLRIALSKLQTLDTVRIIEGKA